MVCTSDSSAMVNSDRQLTSARSSSDHELMATRVTNHTYCVWSKYRSIASSISGRIALRQAALVVRCEVHSLLPSLTHYHHLACTQGFPSLLVVESSCQRCNLELGIAFAASGMI
jgi:hypothetical protein